MSVPAKSMKHDEICLQIPFAQESDAEGGWKYDPEFILNISHQTCASGWDVGMEQVDEVLKVLVRISNAKRPGCSWESNP
jgi:hypothetical protein